MDRKAYVEQIRKELGFDKPSEGGVFIRVDEEDVVIFRQMYEEYLIEYYERLKAEKDE